MIVVSVFVLVGGLTVTGFPTFGTLVLGGVAFGVVVAGGRLELGGVTFVGSTLGIVALAGACTACVVTLETAAGSTEVGACKAVWLENTVPDGVVAGVEIGVLDGVCGAVVLETGVGLKVCVGLETVNALTPTLGLETF